MHLIRGIRIAAGLLLVAELSAIALLLAWSDRPHVRYASLPCVYRAIYGATGPIDLAVVGTSRTRLGIGAAQLEAALGPGAVAVNLGRGFRGPQQQWQEVLDADAARGIRGTIVMEYSRESDIVLRMQRYYGYHPEHAALVPISRFVATQRTKPNEPLFLRFRHVLALGVRRLDFAVDRLVTGRADGNAAVRASTTGRSSCRRADFPLRERTLAAWAERVEARHGSWDRQPERFWPIGSANGESARATIDEAVAYAQARGLAIYFVLLPRYMEAPTSPRFQRYFERRFGAPLLVPPKEVLAELYDGGYSDPNHLRTRGRVVYTAWLAGELSQRGLAARG